MSIFGQNMQNNFPMKRYFGRHLLFSPYRPTLQKVRLFRLLKDHPEFHDKGKRHDFKRTDRSEVSMRSFTPRFYFLISRMKQRGTSYCT